MGVADEFHREMLAHFHHIAWPNGLKSGAIGDTSLIHLSGQHRQGQPGAINHRNIEVLQVMSNATDVIFMAMSHNHAANPLLVLTQKAGVRQHHIHPVHAITGESQTGIHQHQIIAVFENTRVFSNLMKAAKGNHP